MFGTLQLGRKWIDIHKVIPFSCLLHLLWIKWPFLWIVIQFNWRNLISSVEIKIDYSIPSICLSISTHYFLTLFLSTSSLLSHSTSCIHFLNLLFSTLSPLSHSTFSLHFSVHFLFYFVCPPLLSLFTFLTSFPLYFVSPFSLFFSVHFIYQLALYFLILFSQSIFSLPFSSLVSLSTLLSHSNFLYFLSLLTPLLPLLSLHFSHYFLSPFFTLVGSE